MMHLSALLAVIFYLIAAGLCLRDVILKKTGQSKVLMPVVAAGFVFHSVAFALIIYSRHVLMTHWGADSLFWLSWILAALTLLARKIYYYRLTAAFILPVISLCMAGSSVLVHFTDSHPVDAPQLFLVFHVLPVIIAESCLVLAFFLSIAFLIQERRLRSKVNAGLLLWGPALDTLSTYHFWFLMSGFAAMTLAVGSGCLRAIWIGQPLLTFDIYQVSALLAWTALASLLYSRLSLSLSPRRVCQLTVSIGGILVLSFFVIRFIFIIPGHGGIYV